MPLYVRFESAVVNSHDHHTGIFALANGLARSGRLTPEDRAWWRMNNDWLNAAYPNPAEAVPTLFERSINPVATCWFKSSATCVLGRVPGYLDLLDRYNIAWRVRRSEHPGPLLYEDDVQVVVGRSRF